MQYRPSSSKSSGLTVVMVLPKIGFDPSEAAVTWQQLTQHGIRVCFATPDGQPAKADPVMLTGEGLDWWGWIPLLKKLTLVGRMLGANADARLAYAAMANTPEFLAPITYEDIDITTIDGLAFPGGHEIRMRPFLEDTRLRKIVLQAMKGPREQQLPIAAVCHGVLVLARSRDANGHSALRDRTVTALPWAFEHKAWWIGRIFRFWNPNYYRTYLEASGQPTGYMSVEAEIRREQSEEGRFLNPPTTSPTYYYQTSGLHRDSQDDTRPSWVVRDANLVTARWPGDVHQFGETFASVVKAYASHRSTQQTKVSHEEPSHV